LGTYSAPPDPLARIKGTYVKGKKRDAGRERGGEAGEWMRKGRGEKGEEKARKWRGFPCVSLNFPENSL